MRVLFVSPAAELGGAERCLLDCVAALRQQGGVDITVLSFTDGPLLAKVRDLGAITQIVQAPRRVALMGESAFGSGRGPAVVGLLRAAPEVVRFVARLRAAIILARPHVVHTNGMKAHLLGGLVTPARSRLVVHLHDFISPRRASRWLMPALHRVRQSAVFIANSHAVALDFARIAPGASVTTIYNVVDTGYFRDGPTEPIWLAGLAGLPPPTPGTVTFGLVATYARWKGQGLFIEAAQLLRKARPSTALRFYVVGGPIYETLGSQFQPGELLELARRAGIESCFGLVPFQDDIGHVFRALDVVVHASTQPEPFGRTIVEAMASARPVIVARAGGAAELFEEAVNALGFVPGNAANLAEAMRRTLDPAVRARLGHSAREHAVSTFDRSRLGPALLRVYTGGAKGSLESSTLFRNSQTGSQ